MVETKYKHFIFDMGNVLMDFNPKFMLSQYFDDVNKVNKYYEYYFKSNIWSQLDNGDIEFSEIIDDAKINHKEDFQMLESFIETWDQQKWERLKMTKLIKELSDKGYGIHLCSNAASKFHTYMSRYEVFNYFDSITISADIKTSKPCEKIYEVVLSKNKILATDCLFIDDLKENITAAEKLGIDGYHYNGNEKMLRQFLINIHNF